MSAPGCSKPIAGEAPVLPTCFAGDVRVNWRSGAKPSVEVKAGDMISCAGKGRLEVKAATLTKKGKWSVQMVRYL